MKSPKRTSSTPLTSTLRRHLLAPVLLLALAFVLSGCTRGINPVTGNTRALGYTWEQEKELGREADKQIQQQYGVYDDEELGAYVDGIARRVLAESHMRRPDTPAQFRDTEFTFRVLDSPILNAFALPAGYIYVSRGLLTHMNNEAQLAMVLGHEIAHVAARHASQRAARQQLTQIGLIGGAIVGQGVLGDEAGSQILNLGGAAAQLLSLSYSRSHERESDALGVEYAALAGYEAGDGAAFFTTLQRMQAESGRQGLPNWQSTHPDPGDREVRVREMADEWRTRTDMHIRNEAEYLSMVEGTVMGENPRQGFTEGGMFYHPDLAFAFNVPSRYNVVNQASQVVLVGPNEDALMGLTFAREDSPQASADAFAGQQGLDVVDRSTRRFNGIEAQRVLGEAQRQGGGTIRTLAYFFEHEGTQLMFQAIAERERFSNHRDTFTQTIESFGPLLDDDKLNRQPTRIQLYEVSSPGTLSSFVNESDLPEGITMERLAILNQVETGETIEPGRVLKLPN